MEMSPTEAVATIPLRQLQNKFGLNRKQALFAREYAVSGNATQSAISAGYSERSADSQGSKLAGNSKVEKTVDYLHEVIDEKSWLRREWTANKLKEIVLRCLQEESVRDRDGNPTGEWRFDAAGANKAIEQLNRMIGAFNDKVQMEGQINWHLFAQLFNDIPDQEKIASEPNLNMIEHDK